MNSLILSLGSNLGNRQEFLLQAQKAIEIKIGEIQAYSSIYETEPWGFESSGYFLNQVILVITTLQPQDILESINSIEKDLGRVRGKERYSARNIDIDILFYNLDIYISPNLHIPHPEIQNRRFILEPLAEIMGDFVHPILNITISALLRNCKDDCKVVKIGSF